MGTRKATSWRKKAEKTRDDEMMIIRRWGSQPEKRQGKGQEKASQGRSAPGAVPAPFQAKPAHPERQKGQKDPTGAEKGQKSKVAPQRVHKNVPRPALRRRGFEEPYGTSAPPQKRARHAQVRTASGPSYHARCHRVLPKKWLQVQYAPPGGALGLCDQVGKGVSGSLPPMRKKGTLVDSGKPSQKDPPLRGGARGKACESYGISPSSLIYPSRLFIHGGRAGQAAAEEVSVPAAPDLQMVLNIWCAVMYVKYIYLVVVVCWSHPVCVQEGVQLPPGGPPSMC
jgi:hypothetical protein